MGRVTTPVVSTTALIIIPIGFSTATIHDSAHDPPHHTLSSSPSRYTHPTHGFPCVYTVEPTWRLWSVYYRFSRHMVVYRSWPRSNAVTRSAPQLVPLPRFGCRGNVAKSRTLGKPTHRRPFPYPPLTQPLYACVDLAKGRTLQHKYDMHSTLVYIIMRESSHPSADLTHSSRN